MNWTKQRPTKPGWYVARKPDTIANRYIQPWEPIAVEFSDPFQVCVIFHHSIQQASVFYREKPVIIVNLDSNYLDHFEWIGPLPE